MMLKTGLSFFESKILFTSTHIFVLFVEVEPNPSCDDRFRLPVSNTQMANLFFRQHHQPLLHLVEISGSYAFLILPGLLN